MACPECGADQLSFPVPPDLRGYASGDPPRLAVCTRCLSLDRAADAPADLPDFAAVSDELPQDRETAAAVVLLVGLMDSLALHREAIADLLGHVEHGGVDPLLALDRLAADPTLEPAVDLRGRRTQLLQLME